MAAQNGASLPQRPGFFKILFPSPSAKLQIPRKFHSHLPSKLPKTSTLLCPHAEFWYVDIYQAGQDIFFKRGWLEFTKAHDLHTGYLLIFRYNGNMIFEVEVFDTSCCPKDYSLKQCTRSFSRYTEIEDSSGSEDIALISDESDVETHLTDSLREEKKYAIGKEQIVVNEQLNAQEEQTAATHCKSPAYAEIERSSGSETKIFSKESHDSVTERSNSPDSDDKEKEVFEKDSRVIQMKVQNKKSLKITHQATSCTQFEKILTPAMVRGNKIIVPKAFCVKNSLVANCTMFLKRKLEGKVVPNEWMVRFSVEATVNRLGKGWRIFSKENSLKIGDRCVFQLVSNDTFLVETRGLSESLGGESMYVNGTVEGMPNKEKRPTLQQHNFQREQMLPAESLSTKGETKPGYQRATSPDNASMKKQIKRERTILGDNLQCMRIIKGYNLKSYMSLRKTFCMGNGLMSEQIIFLKRSIDGKTWSVQFHPRESEGQLRAGWLDFARENQLEEGDQCTFQPMFQNTFQVNILRKGQKQMSENNWRTGKETIIAESEISLVVRQYHLTCNYMGIPLSFCQRNKLTSSRRMVLKAPDQKIWHVNFFFGGTREGRFRYDGWRRFASENGLKAGDKCLLKLVDEETMLVQIIKAEL